MSTFNLDGIQFTADNNSLGIAGKKTLKFGNANNGDFADVATDGVEKFVNAVEIDWNDAKLGNNVDSTTLTPGEEIIIQTTGQLLSYMSTIAQTTEN
ncbi:MAG: hypothetical protein IKB96_12330 [Prevotella sp.]|nr:hypothetical protein [Prevotella sp.]